MEQIIIGYLLQNGSCPLPGIGKFHIRHHVASYDITNKTMNPPYDGIEFEESPSIKTDNLIETISLKRSINKDAARVLLDKFCLHVKEQLELGNPLNFESIGLLQKNSENKILFTPVETTSFVKPIHAEKIHDPSAQHSRLVGEENVQGDHSQQPDIFELNKKRRPLWQYVILVLVVACIALGVYYFNHNGFNTNTIGNQTPILVPDPPKTYK